MNITEGQAAEGKLHLFVGIDRTSKFAVTRLVDKAVRWSAWAFLEHLLKAIPYRIHSILHDHGIQPAQRPRNCNTACSGQKRFDMICEADDTEHPHQAEPIVGNGQVERMNRTFIVTAKRLHRQSHEQLRTHRADQMAAYSIACRFKTLSGLTL